MEHSIEKMSSILKIVGETTRLSILSFLKNRELCVCDFVELLGLSQPAISQHLKKLKTAQIVLERREGTWAYFRLNQDVESYIKAILENLPLQTEIIDQYLCCNDRKC